MGVFESRWEGVLGLGCFRGIYPLLILGCYCSYKYEGTRDFTSLTGVREGALGGLAVQLASIYGAVADIPAVINALPMQLTG